MQLKYWKFKNCYSSILVETISYEVGSIIEVNRMDKLFIRTLVKAQFSKKDLIISGD